MLKSMSICTEPRRVYGVVLIQAREVCFQPCDNLFTVGREHALQTLAMDVIGSARRAGDFTLR